jgi:hypothetical protein
MAGRLRAAGPGDHGPDDASWRAVAVASRVALALLGYTVTSRCLPGEPNPCGASYAQHAAGYLGKIQAVCAHRLLHLGTAGQQIALEVYGDAISELACDEVPS